MNMKPKIVDGEPMIEHSCTDCHPPKVSMDILKEDLEANDWTSNAVDYILKAVNSHELMLKALKSVFLPDVSVKARDLIVKAIAKAEEI